jgi:hypothetical protein
MLKSTLLASVATLALAGAVAAEGCDTVIFSDVGWTDITATTAATTLVLEALGYETETKVLSVPVTYTGLAEGDIDVFLGNAADYSKPVTKVVRTSIAPDATIGELPKAEASFRRALELAPNDSEARQNWGWYLCTHGRAKESIAARNGDKQLSGGTISLQSESHPVEFRRVEIQILE